MHTKFSKPEMLERLPIIVTANELLGIRIAEVDAVALESRYRMHEFMKQIASVTVDGDIPAPEYDICTSDTATLFNKYSY